MLFHPDKCKWSVLRVIIKQNPIKFDYTLYQHVLQKETSTKYVVGTVNTTFFLYFAYGTCITETVHSISANCLSSACRVVAYNVRGPGVKSHRGHCIFRR